MFTSLTASSAPPVPEAPRTWIKFTKTHILMDEADTTPILEATGTLGLEQTIRNFVTIDLENLLGARGHGLRYGSRNDGEQP